MSFGEVALIIALAAFFSNVILLFLGFYDEW